MDPCIIRVYNLRAISSHVRTNQQRVAEIRNPRRSRTCIKRCQRKQNAEMNLVRKNSDTACQIPLEAVRLGQTREVLRLFLL